MITLYTFGPNLEMPDPSPFVCKAMILIRMAGLDFKADRRFSRFRKAPKGKLPYIDDDGEIVADSFFIRRHIEAKYGFDFDAELNAREKAVSYAVEKMLEEAFYWAIVRARWIEPQNFPTTQRALFGRMPRLMQLVAPIVAQRKVRGYLNAHGFGRHSPDEVRMIAERILRSVSDILGDSAYLMGDRPCGADATVLAFMMAAATPVFTTSVVDSVYDFPNLIAYRDRLRVQYFAG